ILAEPERPVIVYSEPRKKAGRRLKSIRIHVDSASALDQYFFEARKKESLCRPSGQLVAPYAA
ncbi:hypothetical protein, partial [Mesorhizobium sp. M5C.F.Cr.IN.023.01.1.1]|uniref:hypothetical protein n=1 Tax=Mesorhizobium sp. M5C.F.Cr.IN.023.01.1.1 TaxID=2496768 RepID=UPI0019D105FC